MAQDKRRIRWWMLLAVTAVALYLCWLMLQPLVAVVAWAAVLVIVFYPVHPRLIKRLYKPSLSALLSCILVIATILVPVVLVPSPCSNEFSGNNSLQALVSLISV